MSKPIGEPKKEERIIKVKYIFVYHKVLIQTIHTSFLTRYNITFKNSQHKNTNSRGNFVLKKQFLSFFLKISGIQKK